MAEKQERGGKPKKCPCCLSERDLLFLCNAGKGGKYPQYQCRRCGFQFSWPCPTGEEIDRFYASGEYYSQTGNDADPGAYSDYDSQTEYMLNFFRDWLKTFALPEGSAMLDVGCALGRFMDLAWRDFGCECSGVELSDYARNYVKEHYRGVFPVWKSLDEMPVPKKPFDVILLFDVLEHVNDPWELLLGLFRRGCVGENTRILITTPNCAFRDARKDPAKWQYRYPPAHLSFCTPETFRKIGEALLFRHIDVSGHSLAEGGFPAIREMMRKTYDGYLGMACCFSGSALGSICGGDFPATLEELKSSGKYLEMLADFIFERSGEPYNPKFRADLEAFCEGLVSQGEADKKRCSGLEQALEAEKSRGGELAGKCAALEQERAAETAKSAGLERALSAETAKSSGLERALEAEKSRAAELAGNVSRLEKTYSDTLAENRALISEMEQANRDRYAMWRDSLYRIDRQHYLEGRVGELDACRIQQENRLRILDDYRVHLEKQVRELDLARIGLADRLRELEAYRNHLEKQVRELDLARIGLADRLRELEAYKERLENQVRELDLCRIRLEEQVRELDLARIGLEEQVRKLAAELDEVYHSHSYRIGRAITWPVRKCKAAAARLRRAWRRCRQVAKECGAGFMWRCVFRKLAGRPLCRTYDAVTSIGYNCEVSFHLDRVNGFVDSYPLVWAFVHSLRGLPDLIANPLSLAGEHKMKHDHSCNMVRYTDVDVSFHCKGLPSSLLGPDGKVDETRAQAERDELKSRLAYLAKKWKDLLSDPDRTVACIFTPNEQECSTEEMIAVYEALRKYPGVDLVAVLTGREKNVSAAKLRAAGIFVRYISHHPPHDKVTDARLSDLRGWNRICYEFRPRNRKKSDKVYKYEQKAS